MELGQGHGQWHIGRRHARRKGVGQQLCPINEVVRGGVEVKGTMKDTACYAGPFNSSGIYVTRVSLTGHPRNVTGQRQGLVRVWIVYVQLRMLNVTS